jgi:hypothetical protein
VLTALKINMMCSPEMLDHRALRPRKSKLFMNMTVYMKYIKPTAYNSVIRNILLCKGYQTLQVYSVPKTAGKSQKSLLQCEMKFEIIFRIEKETLFSVGQNLSL